MNVEINCTYEKLMPIKDIAPHPRNQNKHPSNQIKVLAKAIEGNGFRAPLVVSKRSGLLICGHGRLAAAKHLKMKQVPVDIQEFKDEAHELAHLLADNKIHHYAEFDIGLTKDILLDLDTGDIDLEITGFEMSELVELLALDDMQDKNADDVPDVPQNVCGVELGDIWELGEHRLMCGDATDKETVGNLMNGKKADMVFTDPPYGVNYSGGHNKRKRDVIIADDLEGKNLTGLFYMSIKAAIDLSKDHAAFYIWYASGKSIETFASLERLPLSVRAIIQWYKVNSGLGAFMSQYIPNCEPCMYLYKTGKSPQWFGPTDEKTVWELKKEIKNEYHPTQKPVELPERAIKNSSKLDDVVLDVFGGSGSTLIACEKTKRKCYMMELDPHYCSVIIKRWEQYAEKKAKKLNEL